VNWFQRHQPATAGQLADMEARILEAVKIQGDRIMAGINDVTSAETTLHADLAAENGLVKQLLTAFANQTLTPAQAQTLVDGMNADDADAKGTIAAIQAALPAAPASA